MINVVSQNGNLLLNISPKSDGTIPDNQQQTLLGVGAWLDVNGEAIYGTHSWTQFQDAPPAGRNAPNIRYTVKGDDLYAIYVGQYPQSITLTALADGKTAGDAVASVTMLGSSGNLTFTRDAAGLHVTPPAAAPCKYAYALKISGLKMNPSTYTESGNPQ